MATRRVFFDDHDAAILTVVVDWFVPAAGAHPGAAALGALDYIDALLGAFSFDPPRVWAGGPFSGRFGGDPGFASFTELSALEALAWRTRIEGSQGRSEREWNGPVRGWQEIYRDGIARLDHTADTDADTDADAAAPAAPSRGFMQCDATEQDARIAAAPREFRELCYAHVCEACYGAPEYGGNRDLGGWRAIEFPGDVQPRGYTDIEVSGRA